MDKSTFYPGPMTLSSTDKIENMKVTINTKILIKKIQLASNTLDTSGLNPILAGILFNVGNNSITLISSNNNCYSQINKFLFFNNFINKW